MKMLIAYIRHEAFEPIRADLLEAVAGQHGAHHLQVGAARRFAGRGRRRGQSEVRCRDRLGPYVRSPLTAASSPSWACRTASPSSPVRMRTASSTGITNSLPSPTEPVRA